MSDRAVSQIFTSPTYGRLSWEQAIVKMAWFMGTDTAASYEIIIGTDSEARLASTSDDESRWAQNGTADYVSALIVHKKGRGGIYFWSRQKIEKIFSMKQRIWQEALISLALAEKMVVEFAQMGLVDLNLEIHVDIGPNGPTREMINEIVGMIRANGFKVATKPAAWGASHVADRHV